MKMFTKLVIGLSCVAVSSFAFANQPSVADCPTPDMVMQHAQFTKAIPSDFQNIWGMQAEAFSFNDKNWNVIFAADLKDVTSSSEALTTGQAYFNSKVTLQEPKVESQGNMMMCIYTDDENNQEYFVAAATPPVQFPQQSHLMRLRHH